MRRFILILLVLINNPFCATIENLDHQKEFSLEAVIAKARALEFNKHSPQVLEGCIYFGGQNIMNARENLYARGFHDSQCPIETLYALYVSLRECWLSKDGKTFVPEGLNGGHTHANYQFLKAVFEDRSNAAV